MSLITFIGQSSRHHQRQFVSVPQAKRTGWRSELICASRQVRTRLCSLHQRIHTSVVALVYPLELASESIPFATAHQQRKAMFCEEQLPNVPAPARVLIVSSLFCVLAPCAVVYMAATTVAEGVVSCGGSIGSYCSSGQLAADLSSCVELQDKITAQTMAEEREDEAVRLNGNFCTLPTELKYMILDEVTTDPQARSGSKRVPFDLGLLLLSREYCNLLRPHLYRSIHVGDPVTFQLLKRTITKDNPSLGELIRNVVISSGSAESGLLDDLAKETDELLFAMSKLHTLSINGMQTFCLTHSPPRLALRHDSDGGPRPVRLKCEANRLESLDKPMFQQVKDVDLVCYALKPQEILALRKAFPQVKRVTLRLVRKSYYGLATNNWRPLPCNPDVQEDEEHEDLDADTETILQRSQSLWSDHPKHRAKPNDFAKALEALRSPSDEASPRLESVTVLTWPSAVRELRGRLTSSDAAEEGAGLEDKEKPFVTTMHELRAAVKSDQQQSDGSTPRRPCPLRLDLNRYRKGRKVDEGVIRAWVEDVPGT